MCVSKMQPQHNKVNSFLGDAGQYYSMVYLSDDKHNLYTWADGIIYRMEIRQYRNYSKLQLEGAKKQHTVQMILWV